MDVSRFTAEKITSVFIALLLSVFVLAVGADGYVSVTKFKFGLLVFLCGAYLLALILSFLMARWKKKPLSRLGLTPIHWLLIVFLLCSAVSAVISPYFPKTVLGAHRWEGLVTVSCYVLIFFGVSLFGTPKKAYLYLFGGTMVLFCSLCFLQFMGKNPFGLYPDGLNYYDAGVSFRNVFLGTTGNCGFTAAILSVAVLVFAVAVVRNKEKQRFLLLIPLFMTVAVLLKIQVAAGILAVSAGLLLLWPLAMVKDHRKKRLVLILLLLLILCGMVLLFFVDPGEGTLYEVHALLHGDWNDDFGTKRLFIWKNVMPLVAEHPFFGGGCDTLGERMTVDFSRYDEGSGILYRASIDAAHNEYLNILVNEGVFACLSYLAALVLSFVAFVKENRRSTSAAIWGGGVLGYCIQAFFGIRLCISAPLFWLCWGLFAASLREDRKEMPSDGFCSL